MLAFDRNLGVMTELNGSGNSFQIYLALSRHRIEINQKSNSMSAPLKFMSSRMSPRASQSSPSYTPSIRHPGTFPRQFLPQAFFVHKYKTPTFVTGKCRLKVKNAGGTYQDGVKWRIDGEFWNMRIEKKGRNFSLELYSGFILFLVYLFILFLF